MELIGFIILLILNFITITLISYFKKKGENLATKDDIEVITRKVESVKDEFVKDNEKLKAKLQIIIKNQQDIYSARNEAILNFLEECNKWLCDAIEVDVSRYYGDNFLVIMDDDTRLLNQSYSKARVAQSKLNIFIDDKEILGKTLRLMTKTLELSHSTMRLIGKMRIDFPKYNNSKDIDERKILSEEIRKDYSLYGEDKKSKCKEIDKAQEELYDILREFMLTNNKYE